MRSLLAAAAAALLVAAAGACGNIISVPDQGTQVLGCRAPDFCYRTDATCVRGPVTGVNVDSGVGTGGGDPTLTASQVSTVCANGEPPSMTDDPSTCYCPASVGSVPVVCMETSQLCVGRGVLCPGVGAACIRSGETCSVSGHSNDAQPPQLVSMGDDGGPTLEPHCAFVDDVCCPGTIGASDGGAGDMSASVDMSVPLDGAPAD